MSILSDEKIRDIFYGIKDYSKLTYEARFSLVKDLIILEDASLDTLEEIKYKIKDMLRVSSSNLNKVINNPKRELKKRDVLEFLQFLEDKILEKKKSLDIVKENVNLNSNKKEENEEILENSEDENVEKVEEKQYREINENNNEVNKLSKIVSEKKELENESRMREEKIETNNEEKNVIQNKDGYLNYDENIVKPKIVSKYSLDLNLEKKLIKQKKDFVPRNREEEILLEKDEPINVEKKESILEENDYKVFEDEHIQVNLLKYKPLGSLEVVLKNRTIEAFNYSFILAKYISSVIFETLKCDGTNIVFKDEKWLIIPRYNGDNVLNLNNKEGDPSALLEVRDLILNNIGGKKKEEKLENKYVNDEISNKAGNNDEVISNNDKENIKESGERSKDDNLKSKAEELLERLRRIP